MSRKLHSYEPFAMLVLQSDGLKGGPRCQYPRTLATISFGGNNTPRHTRFIKINLMRECGSGVHHDYGCHVASPKNVIHAKITIDADVSRSSRMKKMWRNEEQTKASCTFPGRSSPPLHPPSWMAVPVEDHCSGFCREIWLKFGP